MVFVIIGLLAILIVMSALMVSSDCSRQEEREDKWII